MLGQQGTRLEKECDFKDMMLRTKSNFNFITKSDLGH